MPNFLELLEGIVTGAVRIVDDPNCLHNVHLGELQRLLDGAVDDSEKDALAYAIGHLLHGCTPSG